jgi:hypothetical protein
VELALVQVQITQGLKYTLTVGLAGNGNGGVTSDPNGISSPANLLYSFDAGTDVILKAQAAAGATFRIDT